MNNKHAARHPKHGGRPQKREESWARFRSIGVPCLSKKVGSRGTQMQFTQQIYITTIHLACLGALATFRRQPRNTPPWYIQTRQDRQHAYSCTLHCRFRRTVREPMDGNIAGPGGRTPPTPACINNRNKAKRLVYLRRQHRLQHATMLMAYFRVQNTQTPKSKPSNTAIKLVNYYALADGTQITRILLTFQRHQGKSLFPH